MRHELLRARAMNKAYVDFTVGGDLQSPDSVMTAVADWYDGHGTPNERMEARYLLGCTYRDMGEAPRAVEVYLDAAACADTTAKDCDYWMLASIYGQMATLYHQQLLLTYEIDAHRQASHYNYLAGDTLSGLYEQKMIAGVYLLQNKRDSAELVIKNVMQDYCKHGYLQEEIRTSTMLLYLYGGQHEKLNETELLIDRYEKVSDSFVDMHELPSFMRQYYYYKGRYYEDINKLDSAEYYYRKVYRPGMTFVDYDPMYRGLLNVFRRQLNADSIAKYAQLFCAVNDSSIAIKDQEVTARMTASYNYSNYQKKSAESAKKANELQSYVIVLLVIIFICMILSVVLLHRHNLVRQEKQKTIERSRAEIATLRREYEGKISQLKQLERSHERRIDTIQGELGNAKEKNKELQEIILKLNTQFEEERNSLLLGVKEYADKVSEMERQLKISGYKKNSVPFLKLGIVTRIKDYHVKDTDKKLTAEELATLVKETNDYFPDMISDLNGAPGISALGMHVCLLVALNIQPNEITHLLGISSAQVGNLKKDVNNALFGESTAKTLYRNLMSHYKIMSS